MQLKLLTVMTFFVICSFLKLSASDQENDSIVVWRIEPKTGVTDKEADAISGIVTAEVGRVSGRKTVGENEMKALIVGEEMKLSCGAEDTACIAEIGAALGAPESITGTISKMGDYWILTLQRLNVRKVEVISRYENRVKGDVNMIVEMIAPAVKELFGIKETEKPAENKKDVVKKEKKPKKNMTPLMKSGIGIMVVGGAILALGGVAHWRTAVEKERYQNGESGEMSKYNIWKNTAITSYTVGGVALAAGIAMQIADVFIDSPVKTVIVPAESGAHLYLSWRW